MRGTGSNGSGPITVFLVETPACNEGEAIGAASAGHALGKRPAKKAIARRREENRRATLFPDGVGRR